MSILSYAKKNADLTAAFLLALVTTLFVPWSPTSMAHSVNGSLLALLFCLMAIVAGLRKGGLFTSGLRFFFIGNTSTRQMGRFFIFACFFTSMAITNDVSLIIFVPLAISFFKEAHGLREVIPVLTWQTIAANLGSMLTPIGNPQNLFIYAHYELPLSAFLTITGPVVLLSGLCLYGATFTIHDRPMEISAMKETSSSPMKLGLLLLAFGLCILNVLRVLPISYLLLVIVPFLFFLDRSLFREVDYKLLLLFFFLFLLVGNITRIPGLQEKATTLLAGHEFWISLLLSQCISNVPATVMLSPYTDNYTALLLGVNIGGLGTLIASMASMISFKAYLSMRFHWAKAYVMYFTAANLALLVVLVLFQFAVNG